MTDKYNFNLAHLPERDTKPRANGVTMVMDKGISLRQAEDMINTSADYIDFVKLGFGTSLISKNVKEKIKLYKNAGIKVYVGGTLFEAFIVRDKFEDYIKYITDLGCDAAEVSDGSIEIDHAKKCEYINQLANSF
ncbi:MAG: phosphosulfolactate synthase, partial [Bacteroidetes bacterium]|nr:phosphosulfolactate synthase [Bacteroidota bacterium]